MARYRMDQLDKFAAKIQRRAEHVAEAATRKVFEVAQDGVPVDTGRLKASLTFSTGSGPRSHLMASTALTPGFVRGVWASPYARLAHYGSGTRKGTFWRDDAAAQWRRIVQEAVAEAKRAHP